MVARQPGHLPPGAAVRRARRRAHRRGVARAACSRISRSGAGRSMSGAGRMGVLTWDIACAGADGPFVLQVPLVLDEPGAGGRAKRDVPRLNVENMRHFIARGLTRFVVEPLDLTTLDGDVPAAMFAALPDHRPITFGRGALQVELADGKHSWLVPLGPGRDGGSAGRDGRRARLPLRPGRRRRHRPHRRLRQRRRLRRPAPPRRRVRLRLTAARRREAGIGPSLLLLYLIQMMAYEDWEVDGTLIGLPTLIGNPSVAFDGLVRGLRYRCRDLGLPGAGGRAPRRWRGSATSAAPREGRAYRPWVERVPRRPTAASPSAAIRASAGGASSRCGRSWASSSCARARTPRRRTRPRRARCGPSSTRLSRRDRPRPRRTIPAPSAINDLERARARAPARRGAGARRRARRHRRRHPGALAVPQPRPPAGRGAGRARPAPLQEPPLLRPRPRRRRTGDAGRPRSPVERGHAGAPDRQPGDVRRPARSPPARDAAAARTFPTFEAYMDAALHDPAWGYYAHHVSIGRGGHFITNPESLSPRYGKWIARWAFRLWQEMVARGELTDDRPVPDRRVRRRQRAARPRHPRRGRRGRGQRQPTPRRRWRTFAARIAYRIYETSASLRAEAAATLLGARRGRRGGRRAAPRRDAEPGLPRRRAGASC